MKEQIYVDEHEIAKRYGISVSTLRRDRHLGQGFPYHKLGRLCRYNLRECDRFMETKRIQVNN